MNIQYKINKNTILHYVEAHQFGDDDKVDIYTLSFSFYDCHYDVYVSRKDLDSDTGCIQMQGDSKLFESFEEACENDYWNIIKERCAQFDNWYEPF